MDSTLSAKSAQRAVIIGAGRGSRLGHHTEDRPKCLLDGLGGKRLLDWLLEAFHQAGVTQVNFVAGYRAEMIQSEYPQLEYFINDRWKDNNVLQSLLYARPALEDGCVVSYADVLWRPAVVEKLLETPGDIVLVVDRDWRHRYVGRTAHPMSEAEKTISSDGRVLKIGKRVSIDDADGEFAGLAHFTRKGMQTFLAVYDDVRTRPDSPLQAAASLDTAYLTDLLQEVIDRGADVRLVETWGGWVEIDTSEDLETGRELLAEEGIDGLAREFWAVRARRYASLEWARRNDYLKSVVDSGSFVPTDHVL
jgi:choline kinase